MVDQYDVAFKALRQLKTERDAYARKLHNIQIYVDQFEANTVTTSTHSWNCWRWHVNCLLARIRKEVTKDND